MPTVSPSASTPVTGDIIDSDPVVSLVSNFDSVSSSGFGSGPSVLETRSTPGNQDNTTLPTSPVTGATLSEGKMSCPSATYTTTGTQTASYCVSSFSSKTCQELAPQLTPAQLEHELAYFQSLGHLPDFRLTRHNKTMAGNLLRNELSAAVTTEFDCFRVSINKLYSDLNPTIHKLTHDFSRLVETAQQHVNDLKNKNAESPVTAPTSPLHTVTSAPPNFEVDSSVCNLDYHVDFSDLTVEDVLQQIKCDLRGTCGRSMFYCGSKPYSYANVHHKARDYPDCAVFDTIFDKMRTIDPEFSANKYSCLVTHYPDGNAYIPRHSDNEQQIVPDSTIFTVSVGATRTLRLVPTMGLLSQHSFLVNHGSVYSMSSNSQHIWSHEIVRDEKCKEPRVSFTFRQLIDPPARTPIPPIKRPEPVKPWSRIVMGSHRKILLLTDSILQSTPEAIFNRIPEHLCIKKINYELKDVFNFEAEFRHSNFVILACGLNDLSRYGKTCHTLADLVTKRLSHCCDKYPDTTFIFCSLLRTRHQWLNDEIDQFNRIMMDLSITLPNLRFLDTQQALTDHRLTDPSSYIDMSDRHGTHLLLAARKIVTSQLVSAVELLLGRQSRTLKSSRLRGWAWPLRGDFVRLFRETAARIYRNFNNR